MTRIQRKTHRLTWLILAPALLLLVLLFSAPHTDLQPRNADLPAAVGKGELP